MLRRNAQEGFFSETLNVIAILDGDQDGTRQGQRDNTFCIPIESVEKALHKLYLKPHFKPRLDSQKLVKHDRRSLYKDIEPKHLFKQMQKQRLMTTQEIYKLLCDTYDAEFQEFACKLQAFLSRP